MTNIGFFEATFRDMRYAGLIPARRAAWIDPMTALRVA